MISMLEMSEQDLVQINYPQAFNTQCNEIVFLGMKFHLAVLM